MTVPPPVVPERAPLSMACACGAITAWHWRPADNGAGTTYVIDCDCT